jgi:hypothetical protein
VIGRGLLSRCHQTESRHHRGRQMPRPAVVDALPQIADRASAASPVPHASEPAGRSMKIGPRVDVAGVRELLQRLVPGILLADHLCPGKDIQISDEHVRRERRLTVQELNGLPRLGIEAGARLLGGCAGRQSGRVPVRGVDDDAFAAGGVQTYRYAEHPHRIGGCRVEAGIELHPLFRPGKAVARHDGDPVTFRAVRFPTEHVANRHGSGTRPCLGQTQSHDLRVRRDLGAQDGLHDAHTPRVQRQLLVRAVRRVGESGGRAGQPHLAFSTLDVVEGELEGSVCGGVRQRCAEPRAEEKCADDDRVQSTDVADFTWTHVRPSYVQPARVGARPRPPMLTKAVRRDTRGSNGRCRRRARGLSAACRGRADLPEKTLRSAG